MANTKSAKKAARQAIRRTEVNKARTSRARTAVRSVEDAIKSGDKDAAASALRTASPVLARTAQKGVQAGIEPPTTQHRISGPQRIRDARRAAIEVCGRTRAHAERPGSRIAAVLPADHTTDNSSAR